MGIYIYMTSGWLCCFLLTHVQSYIYILYELYCTRLFIYIYIVHLQCCTVKVYDDVSLLSSKRRAVRCSPALSHPLLLGTRSCKVITCWYCMLLLLFLLLFLWWVLLSLTATFSDWAVALLCLDVAPWFLIAMVTLPTSAFTCHCTPGGVSHGLTPPSAMWYSDRPLCHSSGYMLIGGVFGVLGGLFNLAHDQVTRCCAKFWKILRLQHCNKWIWVGSCLQKRLRMRKTFIIFPCVCFERGTPFKRF